MTNAQKRDVFSEMAAAGLFEYGSVISGDSFRELFDIKMPDFGTKKDFDEAEIQEMAAAGFVRDALLNNGKYFRSERDNYRVILPSENESQIISYMTQADKKLKRGIKLNNNTPSHHKANNQDEARMIMKTEYIKDEKRKRA